MSCFQTWWLFKNKLQILHNQATATTKIDEINKPNTYLRVFVRAPEVNNLQI